MKKIIRFITALSILINCLPTWHTLAADDTEKIENIIWLEAEEISENINEGVDILQNDPAASKNGVIYVCGTQPEESVFDFSYRFTSQSGGYYDIYMLASPADADWLEPVKYALDGGDKVYLKDLENYKNYGGGYVSNAFGIGVSWQKVDSKLLSAGEHNICFTYDRARSFENDGKYVALMDAVVIVPSNNEIDLTGMNTDEGRAELLAGALSLGVNGANVTEDLELPESICGEKVTWSSDNASVITDGGKLAGEKGEATLTAVVASGEYAANRVFHINVPGNTETFGKDYAVLKAEQAAVKGYKIEKKVNSLGDSVLYANSTDEDAEFSAEFNFNIDKGGEYELWILATAGNDPWSSPYSYNIDGAADKTNEAAITPLYETADRVSVGWSKAEELDLSEGAHTLKIRLTDLRSATAYDRYYQQLDTVVLIKKDAEWQRSGYSLPSDFVSGGAVTLQKGTHTLTVTVDELRQLGNDFMYYSFDAVAIVPHGSAWNPDGINKPENGIWLEAEDFSFNCKSVEIQDNADASGGKLLHIDTTYFQQKFDLMLASKSFVIEEAGEYDIKVLSTPTNVTHLSRPKWRLDDTSYQYVTAEAESDIVCYAEQYHVPMQWYTFGTVDLQNSSSVYSMVNLSVEEDIYDLYVLANGDFEYGIDNETYSNAGIQKGISTPYHYDKIGTMALKSGVHTVFFKAPDGCVKKVMAVKASAGTGPCGENEWSASGTAYTRLDYNNVIDSKNVAPLQINDSMAGKIMQVRGVYDEATIKYAYSVPKTDEYDIWVLSNTTNVAHLSEFFYSFDGEESVAHSTGIDETLWDYYGQSNGWSKLTTRILPGGTGNIDISFFKRSMDDETIGDIDTILIVPSVWKWQPKGFNLPYDAAKLNVEFTSVSTDNVKTERSGKVNISFGTAVKELTDAQVVFKAEMKWNDEMFLSGVTEPKVLLKDRQKDKEYIDTITLDIPSYAPDGEYTVYVGIAGTDIRSESVKIKIGDKTSTEKRTVSVKSLDLENNCVLFDANFIGIEKARLEYWRDNVLWGVSELGDINVEEKSYNFSNPSLPQLKAGQYDVRFGISGAFSEGKTASYTETADCDIKPLSNGKYYNKTSGKTHFWYVRQNGAMVWDSENYIPMGGMYCPTFIQGYDYRYPQANEERLKEDIKVLDDLKEHGINDLYINANSNGTGNLVAWQRMIDILNEYGFRYGIQLSGSNKKADGYFVGTNVNAVTVDVPDEGTYASGHIVSSWLTNAEYAEGRYFITDENGEIVKRGTASVEKEGGNYILGAEVGEGYAGKRVYFMLKAYDADIYAPNTFEDMDDIHQTMNSFFENVDLGDEVRFVIDPMVNETNYANHTEGFRPYCGTFNADFEEYLKDKYSDVGALNEAWRTTPQLTSFKEAAHLIPAATRGNITWLENAENYKLYGYDNVNGCMWDDCIKFRDIELQYAQMEVADVIKQNAEIPVIYKNVAYFNEFFVNPELSGGHDGVGAEAYGEFDRVAMLSGVNSAICAQSAKTMWNVVTETNIDENIVAKKESGIISYPDKATMYRHFDSLFYGGAKGIFDFLFCNSDEYIKAYAYTEKPELYDWLEEYRKSLNSETVSETNMAASLFTMYPASLATWDWTGRPRAHNKRNAVLRNDDVTTKMVYKLDNGALFSGTNDINTSNDKIVVSINNAPASKVYGPSLNDNFEELLKKKTIIIMGLRNDLGSIPNVDKYYTEEIRTLTHDDEYGNKEGDTVQILNPPEEAEILFKTDDGGVWAFRYGNLWVFANNNWSEGNVRYLSNFDFDNKALALESVKYEQAKESYKIPQTGTQEAVFTFNNYSSKDIKATLIIALNSNEKIITKDISIPANSKDAEIRFEIDNPLTDIEEVSYFLWDSIEGMNPLMQKQ